MAVILGSPEYFAQPRVGSNNTSFVKAIYTDLLHRQVDPSGLSGWLNYLMSNSRSAMAQSILASTEYRTDIVRAGYHQYLGRPADSGELSSGLALLGTVSGTDEQVIAAVVGSAEYFARAGLCQAWMPLAQR